MRQRVGPIVRVLAVMCLLGCAAGSAAAQDEDDLTARQRIFPGVGPGLRSVKRGGDGRLYILASPSPGLQVFDPQGKQVLSIGELPGADASAKTGRALITFGEDCDGAADGKIYVADRGANLLQVFSPDGTLLRSISVKTPVSVAALPEGEVAVGTLREPHLVIVFDKNGRGSGSPNSRTSLPFLSKTITRSGSRSVPTATSPSGSAATEMGFFTGIDRSNVPYAVNTCTRFAPRSAT